MKIQCDVCSKDEASVFCTADEAALCDACDHRVHHANKLASKHQRFSLLHPSSKNFPLCDVCQEKRAFLFCQQDRAILCRDCDVPIHKANEHTQKHSRFLLTGVKLSATSALYIPSSSSAVTNGGDLVPDSKSQKQPSTNKRVPVSLPVSHHPSTAKTSTPNSTVNKTLSSNTTVTKALSSTTTGNKALFSDTTVNKAGDNLLINEGIGSTSSISEYLIETLPGWHVEDFLDIPSTAFGFS
ncbi:B-box zinc finger protein 21 isoform X2 [Manihot esculenta]|uniref:B-box zinc finger protein 21 isoform X2 n=1 Tax=Manihot esculenta TaxID=3983 RepID=UPI000B5D4667|nr:B-box zinc finger protein 21 isoform X2 [Manihot esculenta]